MLVAATAISRHVAGVFACQHPSSVRHRIGAAWAMSFAMMTSCAMMTMLTLSVATPALAQAQYSPDHPEVKKMLNRALDYIESSSPHPRLGGKALEAMTLIKGGRSAESEKVKLAIKVCKEAAERLESMHTGDSVYDLGMAIIFLCELDPDEFRSEITSLMTLLNKWQREEKRGGWGYLDGANLKTGDTSMTQYAVLATWTADRTNAFPIQPTAGTNVLNWLLRTQDPSGGWGYQGVDPGPGGGRVKQIGVQESLSAAGLGSVYVMSDALRLTSGMRKSNSNNGLPSAVRIVREEGKKPSAGPLTEDVDRSRLVEAMERGNRYFSEPKFQGVQDWVYYYMYALERYQSFRELATGQDEKSPDWYNRGVQYLKSTQDESGAWREDDTADTSFGALFLMRGTKKSIQKAAGFDGRLLGGRGLPEDATKVTVGEDGRLVKTPFRGKAESLLAILEAAGDDDFEALDKDFEIVLSDDPRERALELERLRRLVAAEEFGVRLAALKALQNTRNLDNVPVFIYALGDPDPRVVVVARDALRLLSRKINGFGLSDEPSEAAKIDAIARWKEWFLALRPDAQFIN